MNSVKALPGKDRMLIIDDDFINREVLKNIFSSNFRFREAENGLEGLRMVEQHADELCAILLDVQMPEMDGLQLLTILHDRGVSDQIPIFLITSSDELEVAQHAYEMGVMGVINKPVVPFIVERRVQVVVELFRAREALKDRVRHQEQTIRENVETIDALHRSTLEALASAIEFRDVESGEHTNRIYGITKVILQNTEMGASFSDEEIENIAVGSILHDVGKIAISDVILNKPGRLTRAEFETMKTHTVKGAVQLERLIRMQSHPSYMYALDIARHHHERWDGRGYPDGLKGDEITIWSQVVSIADVYDALVSPRVYKKAFSPEKAVSMIVGGECGAFNPRLIECFLQVEPQLREMYASPACSAPAGEASSAELVDALLMTEAVQQAYDLIIGANLTRNSYHIISDERYPYHLPKPSGSFDELIAEGVRSVPEFHRRPFFETFSRDSLMRAHAAGQKSVTMDHPQYADDGLPREVSTAVYFMNDPRNGDVRMICLARCRHQRP